MFNNPILTHVNKSLDKADQIIAIFLVGCMLALTPLYCSAAVIKQHQHVQRVPMLGHISAAVLTRALPVKLTAVRMTLPPILPRHK